MISKLLVAIVILAIITLITVPIVLRYAKDSKKSIGKEIKKMQQENYIGYYADVDSDGIVDGVIYADLAHSKEETTWGRETTHKSKYSYTAKDNLKEYVISEKDAEITTFGTNKIITLKPGSSGEERFYVMALNDFTTANYTKFNWYANGMYYDLSKGWIGRMDPIITKEEFGSGKENTRLMINKWNAAGTSEGYEGATQSDGDIWKYIQEEFTKGWYIPSKGEWTAFADYLANRKINPLTDNYATGSYSNSSGNYNSTYALSKWYWTSSQNSTENVWFISFDNGGMSYGNVIDITSFVRLGMTF